MQGTNGQSDRTWSGFKKQSALITQLDARVDEFETLLKIENDALAKHALLANSKHHSSIFKNSISPVRIGKCKNMSFSVSKSRVVV